MTIPTLPGETPPLRPAEEPVDLGGYDGHDDDGDDAPAAPANALEELRAELARPLKRDPLTLHLRRRDGWSLRFDVDRIDGEALQKLRRSATNKRRTGPGAGEVDDFLLSRLIIATANSAVLRRGEVVVDTATGDTLVIASRTMLNMVGATKAAEAVELLYQDDGQVSAHANAVLEEAGFGEDTTEAPDPTDALGNA